MKISAVMHKLLIEKRMNGFTIIELRDALISIEGASSDLDEARKTVYRQTLRFVKNNWLRVEGAGQKKRYFQTDLFKSLQVTPKTACIKAISPRSPDYSVLEIECNQYKGELEIVLGEIDEYKSLGYRFPELESKLAPLLDQTRMRSALLLGKVNVLTNVLSALSEEHLPC
ncbi:hypothetical protein [Vibrio sp. DW001]|uniref:hypothetical protein n=1 Tax=Vibrio sp. DW001 TaxID=2912315 RepID=UPI0023B1C9EC|nr:hypothetical protein [Vibrio sp. DW001]